jgi:hypothetical protein
MKDWIDQLEKSADYLGGVLQACVEKGLGDEQTVLAIRNAGDEYSYGKTGKFLFKQAAGPASLPGGANIGDPNAWGVPPGQKPPKPGEGAPGAGGQPGQQGQGNMMMPPGEEGAPPVDPNLKNQAGVAPLPHRYNFHLDAVVDRIKKDQIAFAQKKSRDAQNAQHYANVTPQAQQQSQAHVQQVQTQQAAKPSGGSSGGGEKKAALTDKIASWRNRK